MTEVYLALGSNVGDAAQHIADAVALLSELFSDLKQASLYQSKAVGYTNQADFINTAVRGQTDLEPLELLQAIKDIERQLGRIERFHYGPREIDIDIIFYGDTIFKSDELIIPHPHFAERDFVLQPLLDLNSGLRGPLTNQTISELLSQLTTSQKSILAKVDQKA
jgi:2-amino-4-hydroxy-6-hydroxymethyldihydropteridine diphosphokinase